MSLSMNPTPKCKNSFSLDGSTKPSHRQGLFLKKNHEKKVEYGKKGYKQSLADFKIQKWPIF